VTYEDVAKMIDHSLLSPALTAAELEAGTNLARTYGVASVCIVACHVRRATELLAGSGVKPSTTVGFPHGSPSTATKVFEARHAIEDGGEELDMVINIGRALSGDWEYVRSDIAAVCEVTHAHGQKLKVIFENGYLTDAHKQRLCAMCSEIGVDWVKTSTGYGPGGATDDDLRLMRAHSSAKVQVKAAGGVRSLDRLLEVRALGVTRAGATKTAEILDECRRRLDLPPLSVAPISMALGL